MSKCLNSSLLLSDTHERLTVNHRRARLDAVIISQVNLVDVNFFLRFQV